MNFDFNDWRADLLSRVDRGLKYGKSIGAKSIEIYIIKKQNLKISIQTGIINGVQGGSFGVGCRCAINKKIGFAAASGITDQAVNFAVKSALDSAKINQEDNRWRNFVQNNEIGKEGILDSSVIELSSEDAVKGASLIYKEAKDYDPRIVSVNGSIGINFGGFAVGNSEGIAKATISTGAVGTVYLTAVENAKTKMAVDFVIGRGVPVFEGLGTNGAKKAIKLLDSVSLGQTGQMNVIFNNFAVGQLIGKALSNSVNGNSVIEGRSTFSDKINKKVGVSDLTIYDDGQIPGDPTMMAIDGEGYPKQTTKIIENGVLKNFIFDQYYSNINESKNTGNASRVSHENLPYVGLGTVSVVPGSKNLSELASEIENGVLITDLLMGMGHSNLVSGDFSIVAPSCFKVEKGDITTPIEPITIAGNLYKAFNQIISIGNETELILTGKVPSIAFSGFTVSG